MQRPVLLLFLLQLLAGGFHEALVVDPLLEFIDFAAPGGFSLGNGLHPRREARHVCALRRIERGDRALALPVFGQPDGRPERDRPAAGLFKRGRDHEQFLHELPGHVVRLAGQFQPTSVVADQLV